MWVGVINPTIFSQSLNGLCCGKRKFPNTFSFSVLALHNGWEYRNMDARVNTADDPSTSDKTFGSVTT